jgi:Gly-Xaa carboxypeptidase
MEEIAKSFAETAANNRYLIQTSKAATIFNAGIKVRLQGFGSPLRCHLKHTFFRATHSLRVRASCLILALTYSAPVCFEVF